MSDGLSVTALFLEEDDARAVAARLITSGYAASVARGRFAGEDDDEDQPWAVHTDAPAVALELVAEEYDGWVDHPEPPRSSGSAPAALDLPAGPIRISGRGTDRLAAMTERRFAEGVHLVRREENLDEIAALTERFGRPVGLAGLLADLNRQARQTTARGRAPDYAFSWHRDDRDDPRWWPQGITTSADAEAEGVIDGRRLLITSWYSHGVADDNEGSRITVVDLETLRYRHVLLVEPTHDALGRPDLKPLRVHAGGLVWFDHYLHVAGTRRGMYTCNLDDVMRVEPEKDTRGYPYVLPVRFAYEAAADAGHEQLRYSFLSLDRSTDPPELVAGEYGVGQQTTRLVRFELDPTTFHLHSGDDGRSRPLELHDGGVAHMQGACIVRGTHYVTASRGRWRLGDVYVGRPGGFRRHRFALPPGPEDISYWPGTDRLWSLTEYPTRRVVFSMDRARFER